MATLLNEGAAIRIHLGPWERLGALRGDFVVPRSSVVSIQPVDDVLSQVRGLRAPGYGLPGHALIGTWRGRGYKDLVAVYYKRRRGLVITLRHADYDRVVLSTSEGNDLVSQRIAEAV